MTGQALPLREPPAPEPAARPRSVGHAAFSTVATEGLMLALGAVSGALAARWLLPEGRGALAAALFWPQFIASLGFLSLNEATVFRIGLHPSRASVIGASSLWLSLGLAVVLSAAGYALIPFLLTGERESLVPLARAYLLFFVPFNFLGYSLLSTAQGELRFTRFNAFRLFPIAVYLAALLVLWRLDRLSVQSIMAANVGSVAVAALHRLALQRGVLRTAPAWSEVRALLRVAGAFHPSTVLLFLAAQADMLVVLTLWSDAAVGHYAVASTIAASAVMLLSTGVYRVLFPHLSHESDAPSQVYLLAKGVRYLTVLSVGMALLLGLILPWAVPAVYGAAFAGAVAVARLLLAVSVVLSLRNVIVFALKGMGDARGGLVALGIGLAVFAAGAGLVGASFGLSGVVLALGVANAASVAYLVARLKARHGLPPGELWGFQLRTVRELSASLRSLSGPVARLRSRRTPSLRQTP